VDLPRVGVSACLLGERVRWDGRHKRDRWIAGALARRVALVPVCPEVEIGLGIPRPPIRLEEGSGGVRLVMPSSGADLTDRMERFAARRVEALFRGGLDGYILKARSPSCGLKGVVVLGGKTERRRRRGLFAGALLRGIPGLPVVEEGRLEGPAERRRFLARVVAHHRRRTLGGTAMNRWLVKTDAEDYSFRDLRLDGTMRWDGVANALAQKHLRAMAKGDPVLVYETGKVRAVVGTAVVARGPYRDPGAEDPRRVVVDLRVGEPLRRPVTLAAAKADPALRGSVLVRMGRLSVMPVTERQWVRILAMASG